MAWFDPLNNSGGVTFDFFDFTFFSIPPTIKTTDDNILNVAQSKATLIIQRVAKANKTFKSRSPGWSQSIPLLCLQLERPPGTICLETKRHDSTLNLFTPSSFIPPCLLPFFSWWQDNQRTKKGRTNWWKEGSYWESRPTTKIGRF